MQQLEIQITVTGFKVLPCKSSSSMVHCQAYWNKPQFFFWQWSSIATLISIFAACSTIHPGATRGFNNQPVQTIWIFAKLYAVADNCMFDRMVILLGFWKSCSPLHKMKYSEMPMSSWQKIWVGIIVESPIRMLSSNSPLYAVCIPRVTGHNIMAVAKIHHPYFPMEQILTFTVTAVITPTSNNVFAWGIMLS